MKKIIILFFLIVACGFAQVTRIPKPIPSDATGARGSVIMRFQASDSTFYYIDSLKIYVTTPFSGSATSTNQVIQITRTDSSNAIAGRIESKLLAGVGVTGTFWQTIQPISGTVTANAGTGTFTVNGSGVTQPISALTNDTITVIGTFWQATQPVSGTFWQATQPISGSVSVTSAPTTAVTGTFWQTTQPISGAVTATATDLDIRDLDPTDTVTIANSSIAVTGAFYQATQPVSIASMPSTPVTGTFWQATQPISGTVTVGNDSLKFFNNTLLDPVITRQNTLNNSVSTSVRQDTIAARLLRLENANYKAIKLFAFTSATSNTTDTVSRKHTANYLNTIKDTVFTKFYRFSVTADSTIEISNSSLFSSNATIVVRAGYSFTSKDFDVVTFTNWYYRKKSTAAGTTNIDFIFEGY